MFGRLCLLLSAAPMSASPWYESGAVELSPIAHESAIFFVHALEQKIGRRLSEEDLKRMVDPQLAECEKLEKAHDMLQERNDFVRGWVKSVGPLLGAAEDANDASLHKVGSAQQAWLQLTLTLTITLSLTRRCAVYTTPSFS